MPAVIALTPCAQTSATTGQRFIAAVIALSPLVQNHQRASTCAHARRPRRPARSRARRNARHSLLQGRERELLTWLFRAKSIRPWTITPADLGEYVRVNAAPGATRAALSYQRHNLGPEGMAHSRARAERKLAMPVLAVGAESGVGAVLLDTMRLVAADVRGGVFAGCGHYMPEEAPRAVAEQIIRFMGK